MNGLWTVDFVSTLGRMGSGVIVLNEGRLLGGDAGHYYAGRYTTHDNVIEGEVTVIRFDPNSISVLGDIDRYSLTFTGTVGDDFFIGAASLVGEPELQIRMTCKKKEEL